MTDRERAAYREGQRYMLQGLFLISGATCGIMAILLFPLFATIVSGMCP